MKTSIICFVLFLSSFAFAEIKVSCGQQKGAGRAYDYCVRTNTDSKALIYFFHGLMGNENSYKKVIAANLDPLWKQKGIPLPNVITISFGGKWLLSEAEGGKQYYKTFVDTIQPTLETQFNFDSSYHKIIMGFSMGGFNAAQVFARKPELYEKAAFLCPALHTISPYASRQDIDAFIKRTGAQRPLVNLSQDIGKSEFISPTAWDQENPFAVTERMALVNIPVFVAVGSTDQFGFQEGAQAFAELLKTKTNKVDFYLVEGGHCSYPSQELADYLEPSLR